MKQFHTEVHTHPRRVNWLIVNEIPTVHAFTALSIAHQPHFFTKLGCETLTVCSFPFLSTPPPDRSTLGMPLTPISPSDLVSLMLTRKQQLSSDTAPTAYFILGRVVVTSRPRKEAGNHLRQGEFLPQPCQLHVSSSMKKVACSSSMLLKKREDTCSCEVSTDLY